MRLFIFSAAIYFILSAGNSNAAVLYRVSGITDFNLGNWSIADPAIAANINLCAYTSLIGIYSVTVSSVGGFVLSNGFHNIPYTLRWEDSGAGNLGSSGGAALTNGVALTNRQNANVSLFSNDCSTGFPAGPTARIYLNITKADLIAAPTGPAYSGTILIMIGP